MKKDIEIPVVKNVYVAIVHEWNEEFLSKDWNAYIINDRTTAIEMVLIVSKGYDNDIKISTMRHGIGRIEAKSFAKIELMQEDVLKLNNEFFVTFFADDKLYEKRFIFQKDTISEQHVQLLPVMEVDGVLVK